MAAAARLSAPGGLILRDAEDRGIEPVLDQVGQKLAEAFLPQAVAARLQSEIDQAVQHNASLELSLEVADALVDLPWEGLRPGATAGALALHPRVDLYRHVALEGPSPAISIPGPLRILVAIGSPEAQNPRGELLDMERELRIILDAIEPARQSGRAMIRVLERGSVEAIGDALRQQRYHVLYVSCHAAPGRLMLEDADGAADEVSVARFWEEALPADQGVPLIVLAGCSTARAELPGQGEEAEPLPGFARGLVARGVPAVIAMQAPVSDRYATELAGELFEALATWQEPEPLRALAHARRELERQRRADTSPQAKPPEWPTPTFYASGAPLPLYDPTAPFDELKPTPEPPRMKGVVVRQVGDFVGRRREERLMLKHLRAADAAGVLLHGIGGVGKSSLAANVLHRLAIDGWLLASWSGPADCDQLLDQIGRRLLDLCLSQGWDEQHPLRQLSTLVREPKMAWDERLDLLGQHVLAQLPLVFLLDNFEDNLGDDRRVQGDLADLLAAWLEQPGKSRLLFTCRYPFALPEDAAERLDELHLGPLSPAETRKLMLRLPGLGALQPDELLRAYEEVGGHPRALEYLDAVVRGGKARFKDVEARLKQALRARGVGDASKWRPDTAGSLDAALAETATLAADDVLLDELLHRLEHEPLARKLLFGAAVYRVPVDRAALTYQVGEIVDRPEDPERQERLARATKALEEAKAAGEKPDLAALGLSEADILQLMQDMQAMTAPPVEEPERFDEAIALLESLSLLSPVQYADDEGPNHFVHRWTARALIERSSADELADAHRRAATYWHWRFDTLPQSPQQDIEDLLEARHHHHAAGDLDLALSATEHVCLQLETWGGWQRCERLTQEALGWIPVDSGFAAKSYHQLGKFSSNRGDYDQALDWYRKSLEIEEGFGKPADLATSYHQLGVIAHKRGDYNQALNWLLKSLEINEALGHRAHMASSYHLLGIVAHGRGDYDQAVDWYRKSLEIWEVLGDRPGMAGSYHQLGIVAHDRGDDDQALDWYRKSLEINEALGNRGDMASSYHQLGMVAHARGEFDGALQWYRKSLEIKDELGNRAGIANSISQIGVLYTEQGAADEAVPHNLQSLALRLEIGLPQAGIDLHWLTRQRGALGAKRFQQILRQHLGERSGGNVLKMLDDFAARQPKPD